MNCSIWSVRILYLCMNVYVFFIFVVKNYSILMLFRVINYEFKDMLVFVFFVVWLVEFYD